AEPGEAIVARVAVAALAVRQLVADGVVVVALDAHDAPLLQQFDGAIRVRPKRAEVAQAVNRLDFPAARVGQGRRQSQVVAVHAAEDGDARGVRRRGGPRKGWHKGLRTGSTYSTIGGAADRAAATPSASAPGGRPAIR